MSAQPGMIRYNTDNKYFERSTDEGANWTQLDLTGITSLGSPNPIIFTSDGIIRRNTADGSDNGIVSITGGGSLTGYQSRGSYIEVLGNEHSTGAGRLYLGIGNATGAKLSVWNSAGNEALKLDGNTNVLELLYGQLKFPGTVNQSTDPNTFSDFERGTWTPVDNSGAGLSLTAEGVYVKLDVLVLATLDVTYPSNSNGSQVRLSLPFSTSGSIMVNGYGSMLGYTSCSVATITPLASGASIFGYRNNDGTALTNANMSGANIRFTTAYRVA